jgi:hypothetical protein
MASATRRRADSSIEHTVEDYQVDDGPQGDLPKPGYPQIVHLCLWKTFVDHQLGNPPKVFLPHSRWITFSLFTGSCL